MFQHLLITRFNLKNPDWIVTKNNETLLDNSWMEERIELFKNYCLPSIVNQTNKNFKWLLFFDTSTAENFRNSITDLIKNYAFIEVLYIDGMPNFNKSILDYISNNLSGFPYLITSRIDNDDCVSKFFIDEVQQNFNQQNFMAFDYIKGYTLQVEPKVLLGKKEHIFNPFISLIEKNENPKTVWHYVHNQWKKEPRVTQITNKRIWMSIIHEKNKVNEFDGYGNIDWNSINKEFILSKKMNSFVKEKIVSFNQWWFTSFKNYVYVKMVFSSKKIKKFLGVYKFKT